MKNSIMAALTALVAIVLMAWIAPHARIEPVQTISTAPAMASPTPTMGTEQSLPLCETEDGAGMALCWWDADTMGNGEGTSVVSGDCAIDYTGSVIASALCRELHEQASYTYASGEDTITVPNGIDLVGECNYELALLQVETGNDRQIVFDDGFSVLECYKAHLK